MRLRCAHCGNRGLTVAAFFTSTVQGMRIAALCLFSCLCLINLGRNFLSAQEVTLQKCHDWLDSAFPLVHQLEVVEKIARTSVILANTAYFPQLALEARASYQSDVTGIDISIPELEAFGITPPTIPRPDKDQYQIYLELFQLIFDGGGVRQAKRTTIAKAKVKSAEVGVLLEEAHRTVEDLYFGLLLLERQRELHGVYTEELMRNMTRVDNLLANGVADALDKRHMELALLRQSQRGRQLRAAREGLLASLSSLVGKDLSDSLLRFARPDPPSGVDSAVSPSTVFRLAALSELEGKRELAHQEAKALSSRWWPTLGVFGRAGFGKPALNMLSNSFEPYYVVGVAFKWNIAALYTLGGERKVKGLEQQLYTYQLEATKEKYSAEYTALCARVKSMDALVLEDEAMLESLNSMRDLMQLRVDQGTSTVQDLLDILSEIQRLESQRALHDLERLKTLYQMRGMVSEPSKG